MIRPAAHGERRMAHGQCGREIYLSSRPSRNVN